MQTIVLEEIEFELLLMAIAKRYGYDFSNYSTASLKRRIVQFVNNNGYGGIAEIIPPLLHDKEFFDSLLLTISITVTEMFRDPFVYKTLREEVVPFLRTYPSLKIWHAGCASGEEVYSMAILLKEEGLYDRSLIYATDFNNKALDLAGHGIYPVSRIKEYTENYQKAGGRVSFSEYYYSEYDSVIMNRSLKENMVFSTHNLIADGVFGEMHFVMCRNVLIYFNKILQNRVLELFYQSLAPKCFLCLGTKESLRFSTVEKYFKPIGDRTNVFQRK